MQHDVDRDDRRARHWNRRRRVARPARELPHAERPWPQAQDNEAPGGVLPRDRGRSSNLRAARHRRNQPPPADHKPGEHRATPRSRRCPRWACEACRATRCVASSTTSVTRRVEPVSCAWGRRAPKGTRRPRQRGAGLPRLDAATKVQSLAAAGRRPSADAGAAGDPAHRPTRPPPGPADPRSSLREDPRTIGVGGRCQHRAVTEDATILHADLDAFSASVEQRLDPALRGRPMVVGGGCGAGRVYEAKAFGV